MSEGEFGPPGNPVLRHVLEIDLRIPLEQLLSRIFSPVRRTECSDCSIDWRQQGQIAARIIHEAAANRHCVEIVIEPGTVVAHYADKVVLVGSPGAAHAAAVLAADIPGEGERSLGNAAAVFPVALIVSIQDTIVLVDALNLGGIDVRRVGAFRGSGSVALQKIRCVEILPVAILKNGVNVILSEEIAVQNQLEIVVRNPEDLST